MFIFRAVAHQQTSDSLPPYSMYEADTYTVHSIDGGREVKLYRGDFPIYDDNTLHIQVGPKQPNSVVFVMNGDGKTVDKIE